MIARVHRPWFVLTKGVVERLPEDGRRGLCGKLNAAVLLLSRLVYVALASVGHAESTAVGSTAVLCVARACPPKPGISIVSFAVRLL